MKKLDLGQTITILANIGVIAGILFLAIEVRQNSTQIEQATTAIAAQAVFEMNKEANAVRRTVYTDAALTEIVDKGFEDPRSLTATERLRFENYFGTVLNTYEAAYIFWQKGLVDEQDFIGWRYSLCPMLRSEGGRLFWERLATSAYADGFVEDVTEWCRQ
jgi:hypothetical protein